ncbi:MAG TPA: glycosyltransferase family 4 protein, partial [Vicinamibacteria bacterium]|nr:glycosyltransferase family 4 protein [Vicinamibacteria bacterium]
YEYLCHDVYPDGLVAVGLVRENGLAARLWRRLNRACYARARTCYVVGRDMARLLAGRYAVAEERIVFFPCWSPVEWPRRPPVESAFSARLGLEGKVIVQYSGNMGLWHDMVTLVDAAARCGDDPGIHFLFVGNGVRRREAQARARDLGAGNITWMDLAPPQDLADLLRCCHLALVSLRAGLAGVAVPSKLYGILAAGRAVVAQVPDDSEVAAVVREEACGVVVPPADVDALAAAIRRLAADEAERTAMGERAFAAYAGKYARARAAQRAERM